MGMAAFRRAREGYKEVEPNNADPVEKHPTMGEANIPKAASRKKSVPAPAATTPKASE